MVPVVQCKRQLTSAKGGDLAFPAYSQAARTYADIEQVFPREFFPEERRTARASLRNLRSRYRDLCETKEELANKAMDAEIALREALAMTTPTSNKGLSCSPRICPR